MPYGYLLVYGAGLAMGTSGIVPSNTDFKFGTVYQISERGGVWVEVGNSVMFNTNDAVCRLATSSVDQYPYTFIEGAKLALIETPAP